MNIVPESGPRFAKNTNLKPYLDKNMSKTAISQFADQVNEEGMDGTLTSINPKT